MNEPLFKILTQSVLMIALSDESYSLEEESFFDNFMKAFWDPGYGSVELLLEEVAAKIENLSAENKSWQRALKENGELLKSKLSEPEIDMVYQIVDALCKVDKQITEAEQDLAKTFKASLSTS